LSFSIRVRVVKPHASDEKFESAFGHCCPIQGTSRHSAPHLRGGEIIVFLLPCY